MNAVHVAAQLSRHVAIDGDCWRWTGYTDRQGYGVVRVGGRSGRTMLAHRAAYECYVAPIPGDLTLDHLCRKPACVNPWHMEPVPHEVNIARAAAAVTHCKSGHPFDEANTYVDSRGRRGCRTCNLAAVRRYKARKAGQS